MFDQTYSATLTFDATSGLPTGVTNAVKEEILNGAIKTVTSMFSKDTVVVGAGRTVGILGAAYAASILARQRATGQFGWNPYAKAF